MSSYSHKKSIIPIKDVLIPIQDGDVLFPFDHHLASTQLHYPEGWDNHTVTDYGLYTGTNLCATLRKGEGRFGGAVAVEEGTENLVPSNRLKFGGWIAYGGAQVTLTQNVEFPEIGRNDATRIRTTGGTSTLKYYLPIEKSIADQAYTGSVYIKNIGSKPIRFSTQLGHAATVNPGEWTRVITSGIGNGSLWVQLRFSTFNVDDDLDFIAWGPQAERKSFATSFVDGTRSDGILAYPIALPENHTVACYRKSHTDEDYRHIAKRSDGKVFVDGVEDSDYDVGWIAGRNLLFNSDKEYSTTSSILFANILRDTPVSLVEGETYTLSFETKADSPTVSSRIFLNNSLIVYGAFNFSTEWTRFSLTFVYNGDSYQGRQIFPHLYPSGDGTKYARRFKLEKGSTATDWTPAPEDLGYSSDLFMLSNQTGLIDDLMISKRVLSPEEIMAIYHSQRPLYDPNRIDHTVG